MARELFFLQFVRASPRGTNGILSCVLAVIVLNFIQKPQAQFSVCSVLEVVLVYRLTIPFRQSPLKSLSRMQKNKYLVASLLFFFFKKRTLFFFHHQRASWSSQPVSFEINVLTFQSCWGKQFLTNYRLPCINEVIYEGRESPQTVTGPFFFFY